MAIVPTAKGELTMTLKKAINLLKAEYERANGLAFVRKPLAYALYQVWRLVDKEG